METEGSSTSSRKHGTFAHQSFGLDQVKVVALIQGILLIGDFPLSREGCSIGCCNGNMLFRNC